MSRRVSSRAGAKNTRFRRVLVEHHLSHIEMAREHGSSRNNDVVTLLAYLAALKNRDPALNGDRIAEHKARWQDVKAKQVPRPTGNYEYEWGPQRGYGQLEAAHCLPCSLDYDGRDVSELGANVHEKRVLRTPFADVIILPAVYNDADQRAEDEGLRAALESAARAVVRGQPAGAGVDFALIRLVYFQHWVSEAGLAFSRARDLLYPRYEAERARVQELERKRLTGLDPEDLNADDTITFYRDMYEILGEYASMTARRAPLNLSDHELANHVAELESASERAADRRWPRGKLELMHE